MKHQQQEEAKNLYFQTNMSKTEIAEKTGVNRKTILFWSKQGNWDALKMSAIHMPSMVAEKCYHLLDQYMSHLLSESNSMSTFTHKDAQTIHLLATTIKKLKNRSAVNESMEMFGFFMDGLSRRKPELAEAVAPEIEKYMSIRKNVTTADFMLDGFNQSGKIPYPDNDIQEQLADERDEAELARDFQEFLAAQPTVPARQDRAPQAPTSTQETQTNNKPTATDQSPTSTEATPSEGSRIQETQFFIPPEIDYREAIISMRKPNGPNASTNDETESDNRKEIPKPGTNRPDTNNKAA
jgi:hypothetical protein